MAQRQASIDYATLADYLRALGAANRLELLHKLQVPRTSREIEIAPIRQDAGRNPERNLSRQAVEGHLEQLEELGFVHARAAKRDGREAVEYTVNQARLFVVVDELRRIGLMRSTLAALDETALGASNGGAAARAIPTGPALVLANGPYEGQHFALEGGGPWTIGRDKDAPIALPYDPFVSRENTRIHRANGALLVEALPGTRNGTLVNWQPLAEGERRALEPGDALGVGRSLLFLRGR